MFLPWPRPCNPAARPTGYAPPPAAAPTGLTPVEHRRVPPFEEIYPRAGPDSGAIRWAALAPHPALVAWLDRGSPQHWAAVGLAAPPADRPAVRAREKKHPRRHEACSAAELSASCLWSRTGWLHPGSSGASLMWRRGGERPPPGAAKIRHASTHARSRGPDRTRHGRRPVGATKPPGGSASPPAASEGSHPAPGEGNGIRTTARTCTNRARLGGPGAQRPDASPVHAYRAQCRASSTGCSSRSRRAVRALAGLLAEVAAARDAAPATSRGPHRRHLVVRKVGLPGFPRWN